MRDLFVTLVVVGSIPMILMRPWLGVILWSWLSYMNPHKLSWGFARDFPFAQVVGIVTLLGLLFVHEQKKIPWTKETITLTIFILWMVVTTIFALEPDLALLQLEKVLKIQVFTFVTLILMHTRERLDALIWIIALSLGFYGIKGGIFTLMTGGGYHVYGPGGSFIGGNNEIGLALLMIIPLMRYLQLQTTRIWLRLGMTGAIILSIVSIFGTQSRGALVGIVAMGLFLVLKSPKRIRFLAGMALAVPLILGFMPDSWWERMDTIKDYKQDQSALGRLNAWQFAFNLAQDRPMVGGGFETFQRRWFAIYSPEPNRVHDAHSIYFEIMGEHGFVGLGLFVLLGVFTWRSGTWIIKHSRGSPELRWAGNLARMLQVSAIGYGSAGAFLGLAYFDLVYALVAVMVLTRVIVTQHLDDVKVEQVAGDPADDVAENPGARPLTHHGAATNSPTS